jgi:predicted chitinase/archaellum component FlaC
LPENPTIEQLKDAVKAKKTTCAAVLAGYTCGNHDTATLPSGNDYQPQPGDELAMNSIKMEVVEIDAAGNGLGIAHIKAFNNAKLGVEFKGIKVKEGGCIYAGQAVTKSVDLALLNQKQRAALAQAYAIYNKALDKIEENAEGVAETYNSVADLFNGIAKKTQSLIDKLNSGQKITQKEMKDLEILKKQASSKMNKSTDYFLKSLGSEGSQPILEIIKSANESCVCNLEKEEVKKGPLFDHFFVNLEDCQKCLEEQKKKQEQAALVAKAFSDKFESVKNKKMECGCGWNSIVLAIQSFGDNGDCEEIVKLMNDAKKALSNNGFAELSVNTLPFDENTPKGQISIGNICIDKFGVQGVPNSSAITVYNDKKNKFDDPSVEIINNKISISDYSNPSSSFVISTDNNEQARLVEKWMFEEKQILKNEISGIISPELLKEIFPKVDNEDSKLILPFFNKYLIEFGINTCEERIHFFTQIAEETNQLKNLSELPSDYPSSKSKYKGRGLLQLTGWENNYNPFEAYCKGRGLIIDFKNHPEEVATNPQFSVLSAFWYWKIAKKCSRYGNELSEDNLMKISKLVNCGNINFCGFKDNTINGKKEKCYECNPNGWGKRKSEFERLKIKFPCKLK